MGFSKKLQKANVSRRSVLKGMAALGVAGAVVGCSKDDGEDIIYGSGGGNLDNSVAPEDLSKAKIYYACCVHNCGTGTRCVSKLHVVNGRIVRVTSDDSDFAYDGSYRDKNQYNDSRSLTCPKGRSYKYRVHHPGRLKYVLKQTKQRGDMSGFVRITPEQAMMEIAQKYRAIYKKYGAGAIYNTYGTSTGYGGTFSAPGAARTALTSVGRTRATLGGTDYSYHQYNYANPITGHPNIGGPYSSGNNIGNMYHAMAGGAIKNMVSWGSNVLSTNNSASYGYMRAVEYMKEKNQGAKAYFIGPELTDTGVTCHTDWVQLRNYTDTALITAMMYEMLIHTFDENGNIVENPWLDVNYLDTCVYGFFDSPEYWVHNTTGVIVTDDPSDTTNYRHIEAIPAGRSLSAYVMGSNDRLTKAAYNNDPKAINYTAKQFAVKQQYRNGGTCSYPTTKGSATEYSYKKDFNIIKNAEWAEKICGTPASVIRELAWFYCNPDNHPILNEWCGGVQKQENGVINIFSISSLLCVTKSFGMWGEGLYGPWASAVTDASNRNVLGTVDSSVDFLSGVSSGSAGITPKQMSVPGVSNTAWSNCVRFGFLDELKDNGYTATRVPNFDMNSTRYLNDDGSVKTCILWKRDADNKILTYTGDDGLEYYDYVGRETGSPTFVGTRMIITASGGIPLNQSANAGDSAEMYKALKLSGNPSDPDFADTFCLVDFDIYLSPTARYSDYVIPSTVALEAGDWTSIGGETCYRPPVVEPQGDVKDGWTWAYLAYKAQVELGDFSEVGTTVPADAHLKYVKATDGKFRSAHDVSVEEVDKAIAKPASRFYGMTREEVYANQYVPRKNVDEPLTTDPYRTDRSGLIRKNLEAYLTSADLADNPFIFTKYGDNTTANSFNASSLRKMNAADVAEGTSTRPEFTGKMQVYNNTIIWDYEHMFTKYHGWLPKELRGQSNKDEEGDMQVYPIPVYIDFVDCFKEAYGYFQNKNRDFFNGGALTMSTTHDRYRVHSTMDENPLLRELNHRTAGGGWASGNDWKEYATMPERHLLNLNAPIPEMLSTAVLNKNKATASWHEIWMNTDDAKERGIKDGDLCLVENPIGKVRVVARVTDRCMRGHINLHQGGWYDPNPADGVDDGGCANTLMASKSSRYDQGNAQQFAYVKISKVTNFF